MGLGDHKGTQRGRLGAYINKRICGEVIQYSIYYALVPSRICRLSDRLVYTTRQYTTSIENKCMSPDMQSHK